MIAAQSIRARCNHLVSLAIKKGTLVRRECMVCGNPKSVGHHEDYSRPLNVIWLCHKHHCARHRQLGWGCKPLSKVKMRHLSLAVDPIGMQMLEQLKIQDGATHSESARRAIAFYCNAKIGNNFSAKKRKP